MSGTAIRTTLVQFWRRLYVFLVLMVDSIFSVLVLFMTEVQLSVVMLLFSGVCWVSLPWWWW
jgi:hypothetical protein